MARNTIILKDPEKVTYLELVAAGTITPGDVCVVDSNGKAARHNVAGGNAYPLIALQEGWSTGASAAIDTDYAADDTVQLGMLAPGVVANLLVAAGAAAIVKGDLLEISGAGKLRKHVPQTDTDGTGTPAIRTRQLLAVALEAVDNSGGGSAVRIRAMII